MKKKARKLKLTMSTIATTEAATVAAGTGYRSEVTCGGWTCNPTDTCPNWSRPRC